MKSAGRHIGRHTTGQVGRTTRARMSNGKTNYQQKTIDKWDAGVNKVDKHFAPWRVKPHAFSAMHPKLPACGLCGENKEFGIHT